MPQRKLSKPRLVSRWLVPSDGFVQTRLSGTKYESRAAEFSPTGLKLAYRWSGHTEQHYHGLRSGVPSASAITLSSFSKSTGFCRYAMAPACLQASSLLTG